MSDAKRRLEEEYNKIQPESICPKCGDERQEITVDHDTFWVCYSSICDPELHRSLYNDETENHPEDDEVHDGENS